MTDEEIVKRINAQLSVALSLQIQARIEARAVPVGRLAPRAKARIDRLRHNAGLFTRHAMMLIATHKAAVTRWMATRRDTATASALSQQDTAESSLPNEQK